MMSVHLASLTLARERDMHLERGTLNVGNIVISWDAAATPTDPNVEADYPAADTRTSTVKAFIHYVSVKAAQSQWTMFQSGDVIVTFDPGTLDLTGKRKVTFTLPDGLLYTQQLTDREPVEFWSVFVGGETLTKTLLLRRKQ